MRKLITAGYVNGLHLEKDANVLSALATGGPANVEGRGVRVLISDAALRLLLAHMAADPRWSAAFDAMRGVRVAKPEQLRSRAQLAQAMQSAMAVRDLARLDKMLTRLKNSALRATDAEVARAAGMAQGTQTRIRSGHPESAS